MAVSSERTIGEDARGGPGRASILAPRGSATRLVVAALFVGLITAWVQSPVLSCTALSFDDDAYLTSNPLVKAPSWSSAGSFLSEVLEPSTVRGYYQPLAMV